MSRSRTVLITGFWMVANQVLSIVQQIGIVPLFLHFWGDKLYGDWIEMSSITFWFGLADAGMQAYIVNRLTGFFAREEWDKFRRELSSATLMYLVAVGIGAVAVIGGTMFLPLDEHLRAQGRPLAGSAASIFALLGSWVLLSLIGGVANGMYRVAGRADRSTAVSFFQNTAQVSVTATVLLLRGTAVQMAAGYLALAVVVVLFCLWDARKLSPKLTPTLKGAEWNLAVSFFGPSLLFLILNTGRNLTIQGLTVVVTEALGAVAVVSFTTTRTLTGALRMITTVFSNTIWPEMTRMSARGEKDRLALAHSLLVKLSTSLALMGTAVMFVSGTDLYNLWTHRQANPMLLRLFLADALIGTPAFASVTILQATNSLRAMAFLQTSVGLMNVAACWFLVRRWGLPAAVASPIFFTITAFGTVVPVLVQRFLEQPVSNYWRNFYLPASWISVVTLVLIWLLHPHLPHGLIAMSVESVAAFAVVGVLARYFYFNREEVDFLAAIARRILNRRQGSPQ